ncbi:MAG: SMP-30/gluconolactonase/LRE family protein [Acidimicrobiia bacterium]|nr:SMP-30/gluconolactonase/LRE family protein [Acidimicrobiia bacterium]
MSPTPEIVATGILFAEGPTWCADGTLVCTSVANGAVVRVHLDTGRVDPVATVGGGANAAVYASDGGFLVTQNGGVDYSTTGLRIEPMPEYRPITPGLQRVDANGEVTYLLDDGFLAPNDLVVAADGTVWFTDPPHYPPPPGVTGRVHTMTPDGASRVAFDGFTYCNGIALEPDGTPVVVEMMGLQRLLPDGGREWVVEVIGERTGDGFCVDVDGRFYVAVTIDHGIRVFEHDGTEVDFLQIPGKGLVTNCCFGGEGLRTLFATDGLPGQIVAWEGMPTPGLLQHEWPAPSLP